MVCTAAMISLLIHVDVFVKNFKKVLTARLESVILAELSRRIVSSEQTI